MANLAVDLALSSMFQWKDVCAQLCWHPGIGGMAVLALDAKEACMDVRLAVALHACGRRSDEFLVLMTLIAIDLCVAAFQREKFGVVEIAHTVDAIVAFQAGAAKLRLVLLHEGRSLLAAGMAIDAYPEIECINFAAMAVPAYKQLSIVITPVVHKAEMGVGRMVESLAL